MKEQAVNTVTEIKNYISAESLEIGKFKLNVNYLFYTCWNTFNEYVTYIIYKMASSDYLTRSKT